MFAQNKGSENIPGTNLCDIKCLNQMKFTIAIAFKG